MTASLVAALIGFGGVLIGIGGTLFGGWLTRRHEHRRWLLDKRLDVYSELLTVWHTEFLAAGPEQDVDTRNRRYARFFDAWMRCMLIASIFTQEPLAFLDKLVVQYRDTGRLDPMAAGEVLGLLQKMMRRDVLLIRQPWRFKRWVKRRVVSQNVAAREFFEIGRREGRMPDEVQ